MKKALLGFMLLALAACSDPEGATRILSANGMTDIKITGYKLFGCTEYESWHTGFIARGQNGNQVTGVVCKGIFKGSTIRFD